MQAAGQDESRLTVETEPQLPRSANEFFAGVIAMNGRRRYRWDNSTRGNLFGLAALGRFKEKHLLLHDGVVLEHAEGAVHTRPDHGAVVACQSHGDQAHGDSAGFRWRFGLAVRTCGFECCGGVGCRMW